MWKKRPVRRVDEISITTRSSSWPSIAASASAAAAAAAAAVAWSWTTHKLSSLWTIDWHRIAPRRLEFRRLSNAAAAHNPTFPLGQVVYSQFGRQWRIHCSATAAPRHSEFYCTGLYSKTSPVSGEETRKEGKRHESLQSELCYLLFFSLSSSRLHGQTLVHGST